MPITRLGIASPAANTATVLYAAGYSTLASVIIANKSTSTSILPKVDIYISPSGATTASQYAYIIANIELQAGQSFETFKFAINATDTVYVKATTANISASLNGIIQSDDFSAGDFPVVFKNKTISGNFNNITVESNTTATRPLNPSIGYVRFNTNFDTLEVYTSTGWKAVSVN
jgi:hypothetical protein